MVAPQYMAIARKWRPQTFDEVVGQAHITRTLTNALASGRIHHAFLFIGSRGIGKTTTARILAKALNCNKVDAPTVTPCNECDNCVSITAGNNIDVIEIDGASNNGVDDVREIRENISMVPTSSRYKVYIIDEVHQLSSGAFNALLKTLEEPPPHAVFVLATTEAHKIPATIISRCQRYDFRRVGLQDIVTLLKRILSKEDITATDEALQAIARLAEGGVRDAESILDELITFCDKEVTFEDVFDLLGLVDWQAFHALFDAMASGNVGRQLEIVEETTAAGKDLSQFVEDILRYFRNLLVCRTAGASETLLRLPEAEMEAIQARCKQFPLTKLIKIVEQFAELVDAFDSQLAQRTALEALLIRLARVDVEVSLDTVMEKLLLLGAGGIAAQQEMPAPADLPPPNPPEAGPPQEAPAVPAEDRRIHFGGPHQADQWRKLVLEAGQTSLNMGIWLGRATPERLHESGMLALLFEPGAEQARGWFEIPENKAALEAFLRAHTDNILAVSLHQAAKPDNEATAAPQLLARRAAIPKKRYDALAKTPGIATVLDEFKGNIVDVRSP